jgi:hypothetical protein
VELNLCAKEMPEYYDYFSKFVLGGGGRGGESNFSNGHLVTRFYSASSVMSANHHSLL